MSPPYRPDPTDALALLAGFAEMVEEAYRPDVPVEILARILVAIRDERAGLATLARRVTTDLLAEMPDRTLEVDGLGQVTARASKRRTAWDTDSLVAAIVARLADEPGVFFDDEGGMRPYAAIGHNVAARLRECLSISGGKVTGLKALGIDADEYCTVDEAAWSVQLPGQDL